MDDEAGVEGAIPWNQGDTLHEVTGTIDAVHLRKVPGKLRSWIGSIWRCEVPRDLTVPTRFIHAGERDPRDPASQRLGSCIRQKGAS